MTTKIKDQVKQLNKIKKNKTIIMDCKKKNCKYYKNTSIVSVENKVKIK
jgi:hypothetical protein